jgi:hypothetical protein
MNWAVVLRFLLSNSHDCRPMCEQLENRKVADGKMWRGNNFTCVCLELDLRSVAAEQS